MGKFSASANLDNIKDESRTPRLDVPFCGFAFLQDVRIDNEFTSNDARILIMDFVLMPPNEAKYSLDSAKSHWEVHWEPREEDFQEGPDGEDSRVQKELDRLAYRMKYWLGSEEKAKQVAQADGESVSEFWDNLRENIVEAMAPQVNPEVEIGDVIESVNRTFSDDENVSRKKLIHGEPGLYKVGDDTVRVVKVKITGSTYVNSSGEKKGSLQMPKYKGVISNEESDFPVSLSTNEQQGNRDWIDFSKVEPSDDETVSDGGYEF